MIIARAPYRISFLGGGTDFPEWYKENGGAVISTTINKYCYILARWLPPFFEHKHRIVYSAIELPMAVENIGHPAVRETCKYLNIKRGIEIHHAGDLPSKTGMGTSSSFTVALLKALLALQKAKINKRMLAEAAIFIEQGMAKEYVGSQDQTAVAYGGFNRIDFNSKGIKVKSMEHGISPALEVRLMLFFTGFQRNASDIERGKIERVHKDHSFYEELYRLVGDGVEALNRWNFKEFGRLLDYGWGLKKKLSEAVSTDYIDYLYDKGIKAGAEGGKLLGAGGGGFLLFIVEPDAQNSVRKAMGNLLQVPFKFENKGSEIIFNNGDESE